MPQMSTPPTLTNKTQELRRRLTSLQAERQELHYIRKTAFLAAPPMPQGQTPPMDPNAGQAPPQGGPPMDPAMAAQGGAPPMDPAMAAQGGAPPVDPATGAPMDPAAAQGGAPPMDPDILEEILGTLESMAPHIQQLQQKVQQQDEQIQELTQQLMELDAKASATPSAPADPAMAQQPQGGAW